MKSRANRFDLDLTNEEISIVEQTLKTGNLNLFSERFFRLPDGGTRWMPGKIPGDGLDDALGHYRHLFTYDLLYSAWRKAGRPDDKLVVATPDYQYGLRVLWPGGVNPDFLLPHGYLFLDWALPMVSLQTDLSLVIAGTGTSKTSSVAIAALTYCVLYPGYNFMNAAPSDEQSGLMIDEMEKWVGETPFRKFIKPTIRGELFIKKPSALVEIVSPFNQTYPSRFVCKTTGLDANNALGKNIDWTNLDEIQLMKNINDILDKFATRSRAQRPTGAPRGTKASMLTNPGDNPNLGIVAAKITRIIKRNDLIDKGEIQADEKAPRISAIYIKDLNSSINPYISRKQLAFQSSVMDEQSRRRWLQGLVDTSSTNREIPPDLINRCIDKDMDDEIRVSTANPYGAIKIEGPGVVHYEVPPKFGHTYIVLGDPGKTAPTRIEYNNIGVVIVLDVTDFPNQPAQMVYMDFIGDGTYIPWKLSFKYAMLKYRAKGYYDATNLGVTALEDFKSFQNSEPVVKDPLTGELFEVPERRINYRTTPITFAANYKKWARTIFIQFAEDKRFAWPQLERLDHEAAVYAESGPDIKKNADDLLAALFVFSLSLQWEGALWDAVMDRYGWNPDKDAEEAQEMDEWVETASVDRGASRSMGLPRSRGR